MHVCESAGVWKVYDIALFASIWLNDIKMCLIFLIYSIVGNWSFFLASLVGIIKKNCMILTTVYIIIDRELTEEIIWLEWSVVKSNCGDSL